jgi:hypothetical protein
VGQPESFDVAVSTPQVGHMCPDVCFKDLCCHKPGIEVIIALPCLPTPCRNTGAAECKVTVETMETCLDLCIHSMSSTYNWCSRPCRFPLWSYGDICCQVGLSIYWTNASIRALLLACRELDNKITGTLPPNWASLQLLSWLYVHPHFCACSCAFCWICLLAGAHSPIKWWPGE